MICWYCANCYLFSREYYNRSVSRLAFLYGSRPTLRRRWCDSATRAGMNLVILYRDPRVRHTLPPLPGAIPAMVHCPGERLFSCMQSTFRSKSSGPAFFSHSPR
ncbi:protein of unknown function [Methanoculleus bourgensis]|uniref:Uncharacterized protein n=1 Tax=Methanoculleus bourgensis TaxID=83986 RepID=A0A0X3BKQ6_9EURY|nr:protein of unknown function [Methanoculleus bourgensis]